MVALEQLEVWPHLLKPSGGGEGGITSSTASLTVPPLLPPYRPTGFDQLKSIGIVATTVLSAVSITVTVPESRFVT